MRLEPKAQRAKEEAEANFNSIKVRLERELPEANTDSVLFQFHKGAIRTRCLNRTLGTLYYFNSIKVRLEHIDLS